MGLLPLRVIYQVCPEGSYLQTIAEVKLFLNDSTDNVLEEVGPEQDGAKTTPATGKLFFFLVTKIIPVISLAFITLVHSYIVIHCVQVMH